MLLRPLYRLCYTLLRTTLRISGASVSCVDAAIGIYSLDQPCARQCLGHSRGFDVIKKAVAIKYYNEISACKDFRSLPQQGWLHNTALRISPASPQKAVKRLRKSDPLQSLVVVLVVFGYNREVDVICRGFHCLDIIHTGPNS